MIKSLRTIATRIAVAMVIGFGTTLFAAVTTEAQEVKREQDTHAVVEPSRDWLGGIPEAPTEDWEVAFGGRLYDSWALATDAEEPEETHISYPAWGQKSGYVTWRCKECHGWDYKGRDGSYKRGSHYTGIKGLMHLIGKSPKIVQDAIRDSIHGYSTDQISDEALERLALFVTRGQYDADHFIDRESKGAIGDAGLGERIFQNVCAACHGFDGKAINFKTEDNPEYLGTVANKNPWEALHKVRNGHPGVPMPALRFLPIQTLVDILAYVQTRPMK